MSALCGRRLLGWFDGSMVGWLDGWMVGWLDGMITRYVFVGFTPMTTTTTSADDTATIKTTNATNVSCQ